MSYSYPMVRTLKGSPYQSFTEFFDQNGVRAQRFRMDASRRTVLVGDKGTRLTFQPYSLVDMSGRPVTGEVEIRLTEIFSKDEMIRSNKVSTSEDRLLESGGQLFIQANQRYHLLDLRLPVRVEVPVKPALNNPVAMRLFEGGTATTHAFRSDRSFDWKLISRRPVPMIKAGGRKYFRFQLETFQWINCDYYFARRAGRTMVTARYQAPVESFDDQTAFLAFRDLNAVARMYPAGNRFTSFNIPVNLAATIIVMGLEQGQLYFGATEIDHTSNQLFPVEMYPIAETELLEMIHQLTS